MEKPTKEETKQRLIDMLAASNIKKGTKKAYIVEWSMINGMKLVMKDELPPYYEIMLMSGRSILDE